MNKIETRVLVKGSDVKTEYFPQYKDSGWFGLFREWRCMEDAFEDDIDAYYSYLFSGEGKRSKTKESAELACETYQAKKKLEAEIRSKKQLHNKTVKVTSYKHP